MRLVKKVMRPIKKNFGLATDPESPCRCGLEYAN